MYTMADWGRPPGEGIAYPLQYSCLENPMDRGPWRTTVHGVAKSQTQLGNEATTIADSQCYTAETNTIL